MFSLAYMPIKAYLSSFFWQEERKGSVLENQVGGKSEKKGGV
jgi:hypothetical protein